jgi:Zn-dependent oligopeptidase
MARKFNKDMDKYLKSRNERKISIRFGKKSQTEKVPEVAEDQMTVEAAEPSFWSRFFGPKKQIPAEDLTEEEQARLAEMEEEIEAVEAAEEASTNPEEIEALEQAREGLLERFFSSLRLFRHRHEVDDEAEAVMAAEEALEEQKAEMDADVKEVLRIAHTWLGKLTKRQKDNFKESKDFKKYVAVLEKYGIAKKK